MGVNGGGTNRWKSARERERLRARYLVRARVRRRIADAAAPTSAIHDVRRIQASSDAESNDYDDDESSSCHHPRNRCVRCDRRPRPPPKRRGETSVVLNYLRKIIDNDRSAFSISAMARDGHILDRTLPPAFDRMSFASHSSSASDVAAVGGVGVVVVPDDADGNDDHEVASMSYESLLSTGVHWDEADGSTTRRTDAKYYPQPTTLASSKFGREYVTCRLVPYMRNGRESRERRQHHHHLRRRGRNRRLSIVEYASLLGRHDIVRMMLLGGLDPTICDDDAYHDDDHVDDDDDDACERHGDGDDDVKHDDGGGECENCEDDECNDDGGRSSRGGMASRGVLSLLHSIGGGNDGDDDGRGDGDDHDDDDDDDGASTSRAIPLSIWTYVVRAVVEMRMNGTLSDCHSDYNADRDDRNVVGTSSSTTGRHHRRCSMCGVASHRPPPSHRERCRCRRGAPSSSLLVFGPPCHHLFCEPCLWDHLVVRLPSFRPSSMNTNVVSCPICDCEFRGFVHCPGHRDDGGDRGGGRDDGEMEGREVVVSGGDGGGIVRSIEAFRDDDDDGGGTDAVSDDGRRRRIPDAEIRRGRKIRSLAKFLDLPPTSNELKSRNGRRRVDRDRAHGTWERAMRAIVEARQSREVRSDRFLRAVLTSPHLTTAYLDAGVDVDGRNEYGQTPLYLACWKGSTSVVKSLLEYGADHEIPSNGGGTCFGIARRYGRMDVLRALEGYAGITTEEAIAMQRNLITTDVACDRGECRVSVLIDPSVDHPGAGACIVDDAVSETQLEELRKLWESLPVSECDEISGGDATKSHESRRVEGEDGRGIDETSRNKVAYRPTRHYFCDADGAVRAMLEGCVEAARAALALPGGRVESSSTNTTHGRRVPPSSVFQNIRFLHYERAGGILPPHVDLCRVDDASGLRSTHTFILYLTECEHGGGTALLKELRDPKVIVVAQPRRGRALIFPHLCPHSGLEVISAPKLLLRGEVILNFPSSN